MKLNHDTGPILDNGGMGAFFFWAHFFEKRSFCFLASLKQMPFLTTSNEKSFFFKTQSGRSDAIVAPNKGLE